jgi:hypothetical protein
MKMLMKKPTLIISIALVITLGVITSTVFAYGSTFALLEVIPSSDAQGVAADDFNNDGYIDLVLANKKGTPSRVYHNDGTGQMTLVQNLGTSMARKVQAADFNNDGFVDLVIANYDRTDQVWFNNGTGHFYVSGQVLSSVRTYDIEIGDVNNDGYIDIVSCPLNWADNSAGEPISVWLNDGVGNFSEAGQNLIVNDCRALALGDFDEDGFLDIFIARAAEYDVWLNDGTGFFTKKDQIANAPDAILSAALGDLNGDGHLDIFLGTGGYVGKNTVWLGDGEGSFSSTDQRIGSNQTTRAVALVDFDKDGDLDALTGNDFTVSENYIYENDGTGFFTDTGLEVDNGFTSDIATADFNNDGNTDIAFANGIRPNTIYISIPDVSGQPPVGVSVTHEPDPASEGGEVILFASGEDPSGSELEYSWDIVADGVIDGQGASYTLDLSTIDGPGEVFLTLEACNDYGCVLVEYLVPVENVDPEAEIWTSNSKVILGESFTLALTNEYDPSEEDTLAGFQHNFDCEGDGIYEVAFSIENSVACTPSEPGLFTAVGELFDKDGGSNIYSLEFSVITAADASENLIDEIIDQDWGNGLTNSLLGKLDNAISKLEDDNPNNDIAAINSLYAFINTVDSQTGNQIDENFANELINAALRILATLE